MSHYRRDRGCQKAADAGTADRWLQPCPALLPCPDRSRDFKLPVCWPACLSVCLSGRRAVRRTVAPLPAMGWPCHLPPTRKKTKQKTRSKRTREMEWLLRDSTYEALRLTTLFFCAVPLESASFCILVLDVFLLTPPTCGAPVVRFGRAARYRVAAKRSANSPRLRAAAARRAASRTDWSGKPAGSVNKGTSSESMAPICFSTRPPIIIGPVG